MMRDITLGQYYRVESFIHKLDPRTKIIGTFIYMLLIFICDTIPCYIVGILMLGLVIKKSKIPLRYMVRGLRSILVLMIFTVVFQLFFTTGGKLVVNWHFIRIYSTGIKMAVILIIKLVLLVMGSSVMTYTTTPNQLTDGFESVLKPLKVFKVNSHEIAMIMSIALRFIPILVDEADKIMNAQMARGADFEHGGIVKKAKNMLPLLVPLFVSAFRRADELSLAMEARCYFGGEGRTKMKPLKYSNLDKIAATVLTVYTVLVIVLYRFL
ncbi:MAG: energy-coupling factor transporter transmembrane protein EcfT [Lachnospiraceae bacterium]|nr:energy-coupling factor transporter transmembrane protein EcfT [Lachnospiraceae bacterium]